MGKIREAQKDDKEIAQSVKSAKIYMTKIVCLHGVPRTIVSDKGTQFTSKFWNQLHQTWVLG